MNASTLLAFALALAVGGCAPALQIKKIDSAEEKPANVLLFFRVQAGAEAVPGLPETAFTVKEDERVIGAGDDRVLVNPDLRSQQATILVLDLGGRPTTRDLEAIGSAAALLVDKLGNDRRLGIFALDGAEQPSVLAPIGSSPDQLRQAVMKIVHYAPRDPSLDLNGGYVAALHALEKALPPSAGPKIGNLLLVARTADRASRMTAPQVAAEVKGATIDLGRFAIAFGPESATTKLDPFTEGPWLVAPNEAALRADAAQLADAIDAHGRSFYLLSYCSAARAGEHKVKLEVQREHPGKNGRTEVQKGSLVHVFHADGFGPGCVPSVPDGWRPTDAPKAVSITP